MKRVFGLIVITAPDFFAGEAVCLEALLAAGLQKLHLRKPGGGAAEMEELLRQIAPRWRSRLVLHDGRNPDKRDRHPDKEELPGLALRYGVPQIHGVLDVRNGEGLAVSTSVHSWEEVRQLPAGLAYTFIGPLFDSISKPGYRANGALLQRPPGPYPCEVIGLGGIGPDRIPDMIAQGWDGAAVLGWIWQELKPGPVTERYVQLKKIIEKYKA